MDASGGGALLSFVPDLADGVLSLLEGDRTGAWMSLAAAGPFLGAGASTAKIARRGRRAADCYDAARGGFKSFSSLKRALGPAGEGKQWHHIVEQSQVGRFGPEAIHNVDNVVAIPTDIHRKISGFYSSKQPFTGDQTVRQWLSGQSFEQQRAFGEQVLRNFGVGK